MGALDQTSTGGVVGVVDHTLGTTDRAGTVGRTARTPGITHHLRRIAALKGTVDVWLVDHTTGRTLGALGEDRSAARSDATELLAAVLHVAALAPGATSDRIEDVVVTTADAHHLMRPVRTTADPRVMLHLHLDRAEGNLAVARRRLRALDGQIG